MRLNCYFTEYRPGHRMRTLDSLIRMAIKCEIEYVWQEKCSLTDHTNWIKLEVNNCDPKFHHLLHITASEF